MVEPCQTEPGRRASWGRVERDVMFMEKISIGARCTYSAIACLVDRNGAAEFCQATLGNNIGKSRAWINAMIRELEQAGLLRVERVFIDGLQRANRYVLTDRLERGCWNGGAESVGETTDLTPNEAPSFENDRTAGIADRPGATAVKPADTSQDSDSHLSLKYPGVRASGTGNRGEARYHVALTPDWQPDEADLAWALDVCPELDTQAFTERFVLGCLAKGYRYTDYRAGWRKWLAEPKGPLPLRSAIADQFPIESGDAQHDRADLRFDSADSFGGAGPFGRSETGGIHNGLQDRKSFRGGPGRERKTFSIGGNDERPVDLAAFNAGRARACLERLMGRGAPGPLA
jgi:hypothetical protein